LVINGVVASSICRISLVISTTNVSVCNMLFLPYECCTQKTRSINMKLCNNSFWQNQVKILRNKNLLFNFVYIIQLMITMVWHLHVLYFLLNLVWYLTITEICLVCTCKVYFFFWKAAKERRQAAREFGKDYMEYEFLHSRSFLKNKRTNEFVSHSNSIRC